MCAIKVGLYGFNNITVTALKTCFKKAAQNSYKHYSNHIFRQHLFNTLAKIQVCNETPTLQTYLDIYIRALDTRALEKSKYVGANNSPIMNKKILKAITDRTRLRNKFLIRYPEKTFAYPKIKI